MEVRKIQPYQKGTLMQNHVSIFNFESQSVRVVLDDSHTPMFVARDVATTLGYARPNDAIKQHCKGAVKHRTLKTDGGNQKMRVIYEPDVYRLIFGSKLKSAIKFQDWVFEEVLPQIRKTGMYQQYTLLDQYNKAVLEFEKLSDVASEAGRMLNLAGKRFKPKAKQKVIELSIKIQPYLPFSDFGGVK